MKMIESIFPEVNRLQSAVDRRLGLDAVPDSKRLAGGTGELSADRKNAINDLLNFYDMHNMHRLMSEAKQLSGGSGLISDTAVPASFERTVLREALYQMRALELVDAGPHHSAARFRSPIPTGTPPRQAVTTPGNTKVRKSTAPA